MKAECGGARVLLGTVRGVRRLSSVSAYDV